MYSIAKVYNYVLSPTMLVPIKFIELDVFSHVIDPFTEIAMTVYLLLFKLLKAIKAVPDVERKGITLDSFERVMALLV